MNFKDFSQTNPKSNITYQKVLIPMWDDEDNTKLDDLLTVRVEAALEQALEEKGAFLFANLDILEMLSKHFAPHLRHIYISVLSGAHTEAIHANGDLAASWEPNPDEREFFVIIPRLENLSEIGEEDSITSPHYLDVASCNETLIAQLALTAKDDSTAAADEAIAEAHSAMRQLSDQAEELNQNGESGIPMMYEFPLVIAPKSWM